MAYFCFTVLTFRYGGVNAASKALAVDEAVLRKVSELSTNRGEIRTGGGRSAMIVPAAISSFIANLRSAPL
jgi:hypothetical protein